MSECCSRRRQAAFDIVKMFMMLWVVWGHLEAYGIVEKTRTICMDNIKIGVNMPVFFVMSGFFAASAFNKTDWGKILSRAMLYIWPHITIPLLSVLVLMLVCGFDLMSSLRNVHFYWFLRTLAMIYVLCAVICRISRRDCVRWALFASAYVAMLFWPQSLRFWWCAQVIHMYPYFVFGLMVLSKCRLYERPICSIICGAVFLCVAFLCGDFAKEGMNFWLASPYWESVLFDLHWFVTFFARTMVGICGSIFVLFTADVLVRTLPWMRLLAPLGLTSLGIYVLHEYPLILVHKYVSFTPAPAWSRWIVALGWFLFCHVVVLLINRYKISRVVVLGDYDLLYKIFSRNYNRLGKV